MLELIPWLLALELLGLLAFPLLYVLLPQLPDRGYSFAKPLGLIFVFYPFWLLASTPFFTNSLLLLILLVVALAGFSTWVVWRRREDLQDFLKDEWPLLLLEEVVLLGVFAFWATVIAYDPGISHTEQPMDFGFMNATVFSQHFPPNDLWLSGGHVSYYYFGYLIFGGLSQLVAVPTEVGYNLALASVAGLAAMAAFGLAYNMVRAVSGKVTAAALTGVLAVLLLLFISNLEGALELLRAGGKADPGFWQWIDVKGLEGAQPSTQWYPSESGWWWWRATRVIDTVVQGQSLDYTITEFPFFSLLLGDLHPHVMSLPFVLAFLGLALGFFLTPMSGWSVFLERRWLLFLLALTVGGLGFINLWDLPVFGAVLVALGIVKSFASKRVGKWDHYAPFMASLTVVGVGAVLYLPFLFTFHSQAKGVMPVETYVSRPFHFFLVWGLVVVIAIGFMGWEFLAAMWRKPRRWRLLGLAILIAMLPWLVWTLAVAVRLWDLSGAVGAAWKRLVHVAPLALMLAVAGYLALRQARLARLAAGVVPGQPAGNEGAQPDASLTESVPQTATENAAPQGVSEASMAPPSPLSPDEPHSVEEAVPLGLAKAFPLVLFGMAALLLAGPELFRVVDLFGNRMNTMFKLGYEAWVLLAIGCSYAAYALLSRLETAGILERLFGFGWAGIVGIGLLLSLYYPAAAAYTKAAVPSQRATLNGLAHLTNYAPQEYGAILWLREHYTHGDVMVEAVGDDYSDYGRVSSSSGVPAVLGWTFHEEQWRGSRSPFAGRQDDLRLLYETSDIAVAKAILSKYGVTYIYIGSRERAKYGTDGLTKFSDLGQAVFQQGDVVIYHVGK